MQKTVLVLIVSGWAGVLAFAAQPTFKGFLYEGGQLVPNCLIGACSSYVQRSVDTLLPDLLEAETKTAQEETEATDRETPRQDSFVDTTDLGVTGAYKERIKQEKRSYRDRVSVHQKSYRRQVEGFGLLQ